MQEGNYDGSFQAIGNNVSKITVSRLIGDEHLRMNMHTAVKII